MVFGEVRKMVVIDLAPLFLGKRVINLGRLRVALGDDPLRLSNRTNAVAKAIKNGDERRKQNAIPHPLESPIEAQFPMVKKEGKPALENAKSSHFKNHLPRHTDQGEEGIAA